MSEHSIIYDLQHPASGTWKCSAPPRAFCHAEFDCVVISTSAGAEFPSVEYDDETDEIISPTDPHEAWLSSFEEVKGQGWWQRLTPDNLRSPAYTPLTTFEDALEEKNSATVGKGAR